MLAPVSSPHTPATPTAANDSIGKMEEAINKALEDHVPKAIGRNVQSDSRHESMSYMEAVKIIRDGVESGAIGTSDEMPKESLNFDYEGGTPHITRHGLENLSALYQVFGSSDVSQNSRFKMYGCGGSNERFTQLETAKSDEGLDISDPSRLVPEDGQVSREDLEIFAKDAGIPDSNDIITNFEQVRYNWFGLGFNDTPEGETIDLDDHTVSYREVAEKARFGKAADVLLDHWASAERATNYSFDNIPVPTIDGGISKPEMELDTAGPANAEFIAELRRHELYVNAPFPDHVFSLADFNAYLGE